MHKVVVNSTPIISLAIIEKLDLLSRLYKKVYIPQAVFDEVSVDGKSRTGAELLKKAKFINIISVGNDTARKFFSTSLHEGEVEVMILAKEIEADIVIIDDYQARKHAKYLGLNLTGTLGAYFYFVKLTSFQLFRYLH
ncbi:DUF3368 domain-containing protein [Natronospora cellulosivora (SeqCode)]